MVSCYGILVNLLATRNLALYLVFLQSLPSWPTPPHNPCAGDRQCSPSLLQACTSYAACSHPGVFMVISSISGKQDFPPLPNLFLFSVQKYRLNIHMQRSDHTSSSISKIYPNPGPFHCYHCQCSTPNRPIIPCLDNFSQLQNDHLPSTLTSYNPLFTPSLHPA